MIWRDNFLKILIFQTKSVEVVCGMEEDGLRDPVLPLLKTQGTSFFSTYATEIWLFLAILIVLYFVLSKLKTYFPGKTVDFGTDLCFEILIP
jgi:hypothetical protein